MDSREYKTQHKKVLSLFRQAYVLGRIKHGLSELDIVDFGLFLRRHKSTQHASVDIEALSEVNFLVANSQCKLVTKLLWDFLFLTALRVQEATQNTWSNVDFDNEILYVPEELAKNGLQNTIPLSPQAIRTLKLAKVLSIDSDYIFPSPQSTKNQHKQKYLG
ncbi:phage integrase [Vibrio variabilis]|uniref:Phage integrase n=1 Tax=Vibrio variabilis TaxID=990271 RepID=A0ABQ0JPZ8_9VIBR|nr:phage integrase [Vibrio variabilis]